MIDHTGITVNDFARSQVFYTAALEPLGYRLLKDLGVAVGFGVREGFGRSLDPGGDFWISRGELHHPRVDIAFAAESCDAVDAFYNASPPEGRTTVRPDCARITKQVTTVPSSSTPTATTLRRFATFDKSRDDRRLCPAAAARHAFG